MMPRSGITPGAAGRMRRRSRAPCQPGAAGRAGAAERSSKPDAVGLRDFSRAFYLSVMVFLKYPFCTRYVCTMDHRGVYYYRLYSPVRPLYLKMRSIFVLGRICSFF